MKVKKLLAITIVLALLVSLMIPSTATAGPAMSTQVLYADKDVPVGHVYVSNDEEYIYVDYVLNVDGWVLTKVHLAVETSEEALPQNKVGNPEPGKFEFNDEFDFEDGITEANFVIAIPDELPDMNEIYIAAHANIEKVDCVVNAEGPYGGVVLDYEQGLTYNGNPIPAALTHPDSVDTYEVGRSWTNFISLGFQSEIFGEETAWLIVEFDNPVVNGSGSDILVVEDTYGPYPLEKALVQASQDGEVWFDLGLTNDRFGLDNHTETYFDLGSLEWAGYIKVSERSIRENFVNTYGDPNGFDLNAVLALHDNITCTEYAESAWADGERFVVRGNWATYFKYNVREWILVQSLEVACDHGPAVVSEALDSGGFYKIEAVGTYRFANWGVAGIADARYSYRVASQVPAGYPVSPDPQWVDGADLPGSWEYYLQLWIDGANVLWAEELNEAHTYTAELTGTGSTLEFIILDSSYGDNSGALTVNIYEWSY